MPSSLPTPDHRRSLEATFRFALWSGAWVVRHPLRVRTEKTQTLAASREDLTAIREDLGDCRRCRLWEGRSQIVFGVGNPRAELLFVGEGPGADEDRTGEPFVGKAGQLLDLMIRAIGRRREDVYIGNVVKCRPPGNRDPREDETAACLPFLWRQIEAVAPRVVCALGAPAARSLLETEASIGSLRGRPAVARGVTVVPTYHPAYLLRNPIAKRQAWQDLKTVRDLLGPRV